MKKVEDSLELDKAWDLPTVEYEGKRVRRESLDEMKRALAAYGPDTATARALYV